MNKILNFFILFLFISNCSLDTKTGLWSQSEKLSSEKESVEEKLFEDTKIYEKEFNPELKIRLKNNFKKNSFVNNLLNNNGVIQFNGKLSKISKYRFSKISQFDYYQPELLITKKNTLIFFDEKGTILNFSDNGKLIWKNNIYSKNDKKHNPILYFASNDQTLVVSDSIAKYYAINLNNGELLWSKNNAAPFNSQVKIFKDKFFAIDFENILRCYSIKDGVEIWNVKTETSLIRSQKKLSMVIVKEKIYFNNSLGDISAVNIENGEILWQRPTQTSLIYDEGFFLKTSDIIADNDNLYFSNNKNQFFSLDITTGLLNWVQKVNSNLRPTMVDRYLFTVSLEGYLIVIDKQSGNIIRSTDIFKNFKAKNRSKIQPVGFILGTNNIYLTTDNGKLLIIDITTGITSSILKIDNGKISRPSIVNQELYIIKDNSIIKLN